MIDIKSGALFPWQFRLIALLTAIAGLAMVNLHPWITLILVVAGTLVWVSSEGTEIDVDKKTFREYTSFLFIKTGKFQHYQEIEKIYVTKSKQSQQMYTAHTTHSSVFEDVVYNAYLKFTSGEKVHLMTRKDKDKILKELGPLSKKLTLDVVDHS